MTQESTGDTTLYHLTFDKGHQAYASFLFVILNLIGDPYLFVILHLL